MINIDKVRLAFLSLKSRIYYPYHCDGIIYGIIQLIYLRIQLQICISNVLTFDIKKNYPTVNFVYK